RGAPVVDDGLPRVWLVERGAARGRDDPRSARRRRRELGPAAPCRRSVPPAGGDDVSAAPAMRPEQTPDDELRALRERVSAIDREILAAVNERLEVVAEIVRHKQATGRSLYDAGREESMLAELLRANRGGLSDDGVAELQAALLYLTKRQLGIAASVGR